MHTLDLQSQEEADKKRLKMLEHQVQENCIHDIANLFYYCCVAVSLFPSAYKLLTFRLLQYSLPLEGKTKIFPDIVS